MKKFIIVVLALFIMVSCHHNGAFAQNEGKEAANVPVEETATTPEGEPSGEAESASDVTAAENMNPEEGEAASEEPATLITQELAGSDYLSRYDTKPFKEGNAAYMELAELWRQAKSALSANDTDEAQRLMTELQGRCLDFGISSFEDLSASIIKEGMLQLDTGDTDNAINLFETAINISPDYPPAYFAKGWAIFKHNRLKFLVTIDCFIQGAAMGAKNFWWSFNFIGNKVSSLLFTLAALFSLFGLISAVRYMPLLTHDLAEKFGMMGKEPLLRYIAAPLSLLAILFLLGYWWAVTLVFLLLWVYFNKREKVLSVLFFVIVIFMPAIMSYYAGFLHANGSTSLWVMDEVNKGIIETGSENYLRQSMKSEPDNNLYRLSLAQIYRKERRLDEAVTAYESLIKTDPQSVIYRNNLGNVYLLSGRVDDAIEQYNAAIQYNPKKALPHFNLSQAYSEKLMFTEREQEKNAAYSLAPDLVDAITERSGETPYRFMFDELIPAGEFRDLALKKTPESKMLADSIWSTMVRIMPLSGMPFAGAGMIILLFAVNAFRKRGIFSHFCDKCGAVSCRNCQRPHFSKDLCVQCYLTFVKMEGVEARDRVRKTIEIREWQQKTWLISRISSLLMPGAGHLLAGRPYRGFILAGLFLFFFKDIFFGSFIESPYGISLDIYSPDKIVMFFLMVAVYLISQADIHRLSAKNKG